jgi:hypothetical protein
MMLSDVSHTNAASHMQDALCLAGWRNAMVPRETPALRSSNCGGDLHISHGNGNYVERLPYAGPEATGQSQRSGSKDYEMLYYMNEGAMEVIIL